LVIGNLKLEIGIGGIMIKILFCLLIILIIMVPCRGYDEEGVKQELRSILEKQKRAWNEGDIEGFMADYWKSDEMTFQSGGNRIHGWDTLLQRYKTNYAGEKMGVLNFTDLEITVLTRDVAYVLGRYHVKQKEAVLEGVFTVIFKRMPEGWKIIHDHSSQKQ
jgi:beta-aspartyl-peptidase (threonine type)